MGPVISDASKKRIHGMVNTAVSQGATIKIGGEYPKMTSPFDKGNFYAPTVLAVTPKMDVWREEVIQ